MIDGQNEYPQLTAKSNESRHLVMPMLDLLQRTLGGHSHFERHLIAAYERLSEMNAIVTGGGIMLSDLESFRLLESCESFLLHYNALTTECMRTGRHRFNFATKFHELWHICHFGKYMNPRAPWCYAFEDFVKQIRKVGVSCALASPMHLVPEQVVDNYLRAMSFDLDDWKH